MKIAFICAYPYAANRAVNPGMLSVDLAVKSVLNMMPGDAEITLFCAEQEFTISLGTVSLEYVYLHDQEQLSGFDKIVYWGDFLHWIGYASHDWLARCKKREPDRSEEEILDTWYRLFLLENAPNLQKKAVIFGGTLYGLDGCQLLDARYRLALESLYGNARLVLMRDHLSANLVTQFASKHVAAFGCDCALLLDSRQLLPQEGLLQKNGIPDPYMLCSFGRSGARVALHAFAVNLAAQMDIKLIPFDWLGMGGLAEKLALVRNARYVVTDIYHLSVSAWREKVPALCAGKGTSYVSSTLSDKKKEIFYGQVFASDKYLYLEDILDALRSDEDLLAYIRRCIEVIGNENANRVVFDMIDRQKERALARLIDSLSQ